MFKTLNPLVISLAALVMPLTATTVKAASVTLWYNGDYNNGITGVNGINNGFSTSLGDGIVYEDFIVPNTSSNWVIDSVFSNNQMTFATTQASWEILSGVSAGDGGTSIASGTNAATQVATGRSYNPSNGEPPEPEYTIQVSGLNVTLTPGTYWLGIVPISDGSGTSYVSTTSGVNAVGMPMGNNDNSFYSSSSEGIFQPASGSPPFSAGTANFSLGVKGTATPVPFEFSPTWGIGILGAWAAINKLKRTKGKPNSQ